MNKRRRIAIAVLALVLGGLAIGWLYRRMHSSDNGKVVTLYGNVDIREVEPAFNDNGPVVQMLVSEGASVKKGQLLARIDDSRYAARFAQANLQAQSLHAVLSRLLHGSRAEEIAQARATMQALQAVYENNKAVYARTAGLVPQGVASTEERDNAKTQELASRDNYRAAAQAYALALKGPRAEDVAAARRAYEAAAAATLAQRELDDTRLYAPADGIVENRILEPGDMASPNTPVFTIALANPLWVRAYVPENELGKLAPGMPATIRTDSFPGHRYRGWVGYVSPVAEFTPKTVETPELRTRLVYQVRIYACNSHGELRLGMPATVEIDVAPPSRSAVGGSRPLDCTDDDAGHP